MIRVSAFMNLIPHAVATQNGTVANDGLGIIRSFLLPTEVYAAMIGKTFAEEPEYEEG